MTLDRQTAAELTRAGLDALGDVAKRALDGHDLETAERVDGQWGDILAAGLDEAYGDLPGLAVPEGAVELFNDVPEAERERRATVAELRERRAAWRFALFAWALRQRSPGGRQEHWDAAARLFARHFGEPAEVTEAARLALTLAQQRQWAFWTVVVEPDNRAHGFGFEGPLLRAYACLLAARTEPTAPSLALPAQEWLWRRRAEVVDLVAALTADDLAWDAPQVEQLEERKSAVRHALEAASADFDAIRRARLRAARVDRARATEAEQAVRDGWAESRLAAFLFDRAGRYVEHSAPPDEEVQTFGARTLVPKERLLADARASVSGLEVNRVGEGLAEGELIEVLRRLSDAPRAPVAPERSLRAAVLDALSELAGEDGPPPVVFIPNDWRVRRLLVGVGGVERQLRERMEQDGLPRRAQPRLAGELEGNLVLRWPTLPRESVLVVAFGSLGSWEQWPADSAGHLLQVRVHDLDEQEAYAEAETERREGRLEPGQSIDARAEELQERAIIEVNERLTLNVEPAAARWIPVPHDIGA
jgi:hypothetical protein